MTKPKVRKGSRFRSLRDLYSRSQRWTKGVNALDRDGDACPSRSKDAVSWCLGGALAHVYGEGGQQTKAWEILRSLIVQRTRGHVHGISVYNDDQHRRFYQIRSLVRAAKI